MTAEVPEDLKAFLCAHKRLRYEADECEPGAIKLLSSSKLSVGSVWVNARPLR